MSERKKEFTAVLKCGHCGNRAPMEIVATYSYERQSDPDWDHADHYQLSACPACNEVSLRTYYWHDAMEPDDVTFTTLYPSGAKTLPGLPVAVRKAYDAALKVRPIDPNAYAVLVGRVLEIICEDRDAKGRSLNEKLTDLAAKGEIPGKLVDVAHGLRNLRNVGAHAALGELTEEEVPILDDLCQAILAYVYNAPFLARMVTEHFEKLKKRGRTKGSNPAE